MKASKELKRWKWKIEFPKFQIYWVLGVQLCSWRIELISISLLSVSLMRNGTLCQCSRVNRRRDALLMHEYFTAQILNLGSSQISQEIRQLTICLHNSQPKWYEFQKKEFSFVNLSEKSGKDKHRLRVDKQKHERDKIDMKCNQNWNHPCSCWHKEFIKESRAAAVVALRRICEDDSWMPKKEECWQVKVDSKIRRTSTKSAMKFHSRGRIRIFIVLFVHQNIKRLSETKAKWPLELITEQFGKNPSENLSKNLLINYSLEKTGDSSSVDSYYGFMLLGLNAGLSSSLTS